MTCIKGATTQQAMVAFELIHIAEKHGVNVEFNFSDWRNPHVNFVGGTTAQQEALAREIADRYMEV